jgi:hypothetical protein
MRTLVFVPFLFLHVACRQNDDRHERVNKLRGIGVAATPPVTAATIGEALANVKLSVVFAAPKGSSIEATTFVDSASSQIQKIEGLVIDESSRKSSDDGALTFYTFDANFSAPSSDLFALPGYQNGVRLRYGFEAAIGDDEETMIGDVVMAPEGAKQLAYENPVVSILLPATGETVAKDAEVTIEGAADNKNDELLKYGWFVSSGEVQNRRAKSTTWTGFEEGEQTAIFTVRGRSSRAFAYAVVKIQVQ